MIRCKSHKQALIIAALVILLCLVCLSGATYALFTNDPNDGTIGIVTTSGKVDVDIINDYDGKTLVGETLEFVTLRENQKVLFEPGATFYTQGFKVKNIGDVSIKFRVTVSEDKNVDMTEFHKAFDVWITTDLSDPTAAQPLTEFIGELAVERVSEKTYYLFIKMKESAGNEFQNKTYSGIGVTVYAVQGNVDFEEWLQ